MKRWFYNLTPKEQWSCVISIVLILIYSLSTFVFIPLSKGITSLEAQYRYQKQLLTWMQTTKKTALQDTPHHNSIEKHADMLSLIAQELRRHKNLTSYPFKLSQVSQKKASLRFKAVPMPLLLKVVRALSPHMHLESLSLTPTQQSGVAKASLMFEN